MKKNAIVAGTGFEGRNKVIRSHCKEGMKIVLKRDSSNIDDENAIEVYLIIPRLYGLLGYKEVQIGFIKANTAISLAKKMDEGTKLSSHVVSYYAPDSMDHPRVSIEVSDES